MESKKYGLDTIVGVALQKPREGKALLNWTGTKLVNGKGSFWVANDEIFQIVSTEDPSAFRLEVKVLGDKYCGVGPFHSLAAAKEAGERIWAKMLRGKIHYSQFIASGNVFVASSGLFPNL